MRGKSGPILGPVGTNINKYKITNITILVASSQLSDPPMKCRQLHGGWTWMVLGSALWSDLHILFLSPSFGSFSLLLPNRIMMVDSSQFGLSRCPVVRVETKLQRHKVHTGSEWSTLFWREICFALLGLPASKWQHHLTPACVPSSSSGPRF